MDLISKIHIKPNTNEFKECERLCTSVRNLYNFTLSEIHKYNVIHGQLFYVNVGTNKNEYIHTLKYLNYTYKHNPLYTHDVNGNKLNSKYMKSAFRLIDRSFKAYYAAIKDFKKNPSKYKSMPKLPKPNYKSKQMVVLVPNDAYSLSKCKRYVKVSMSDIVIDITHLDITDKSQLAELQIIPCTYGYKVTILVKNMKKSKPICDSGKIAGIDIGLNNLIALAYNTSGSKPFLIDGKHLKNINQYYNYKLAKLKSNLPNGIMTSKAIKKLTQTRNNHIENYMHLVSKFVVETLVDNNIQYLVVGSNKQWKTGINIGKRNNQNFVSIPFFKLKQMLKYKCELNGIECIEREESYTSKCSFIDLEPIQKQDTYVGSRVKRGLFKSSSGICVNADINGALNIIRKEFGNEYFNHEKLSLLFSNINKIKLM